MEQYSTADAVIIVLTSIINIIALALGIGTLINLLKIKKSNGKNIGNKSLSTL